MRYDKMSSFIVMDIVREAGKYPNAVHFEIGQPDLSPSVKIKAALQTALTDNRFAYTREIAQMREGVERMKRWLPTVKK